MKTKRIKLEIDVLSNKQPVKETVVAYQTGPGLAVHPTWLGRDNEGRINQTPSNTWVITHIPSGRCVLKSFARRKDAVLTAGFLQPLADWTQPDGVTVLVSNSDLQAEIKQMLREHRL